MIDRDKFIGMMLGMFAADSFVHDSTLSSSMLNWTGNTEWAKRCGKVFRENALQSLPVLKSIRRRNFCQPQVLATNVGRNPLQTSADPYYEGHVNFERVHVADRRRFGLPDKVTREECQDYLCGTIIRAAPLAALELDHVNLLGIISQHARLTHKSAESIFSDQCFVFSLKDLMAGKSPDATFDQLVTSINHPTSPFVNNKTFTTSDGESRRVHESAMQSLLNGLLSLKKDSDFKSAIIRIKDEPGNSILDAPIAGALWGAATGSVGVPSEWLSKVECRDEIVQEIDRILAAGVRAA